MGLAVFTRAVNFSLYIIRAHGARIVEFKIVKSSVLIVDDEESIRSALTNILTDEGYLTLAAASGEEALKLVKSESPRVALLDIWMPGIDGLQTLRLIKDIDPEIEVIMMSGHGAVETAARSIRFGAFDFIEKPFSIEALSAKVARAQRRAADERAIGSRSDVQRRAMFENMRLIGSSASARRTHQRIIEASKSDAPVFLVGESGLGKRHAARFIHANSSRYRSAFVEVWSTDVIQERLLEKLEGSPGSEDGLLARASGGTIFFEYLDRLALPIQRDLARALADFGARRADPAGKAEARFIASSSSMSAKKIAPELLALFSVDRKVIRFQPLRARRADIGEFALNFIDSISDEIDRDIRAIEPALIEELSKFDWPGNLDQLNNALTSAAREVSGDELKLAHFNKTFIDSGARLKKEVAPGDNRKVGAPRPRAEPQRTLKKSIVLCGQGLHSGIKTGLILTPSEPGSGIVFSDISTGARIRASIEHVTSTDYATTLSDGIVMIKTIEHIMSALASYRITNLLIKIGDEAPIRDGSSRDFCDLIEDAGVQEQDDFIEPLLVDEPIEIVDKRSGASLSCHPSETFSVEYQLDYPPPIGRQEALYRYSTPRYYRDNIASARTFGFVSDIKELNEAGLAEGGKLSNVILIDKGKALNTELRFPNELARHKILDLIGDLYLLGQPVIGAFKAIRSGHTQNTEMVRRLKERFDTARR